MRPVAFALASKTLEVLVSYYLSLLPICPQLLIAAKLETDSLSRSHWVSDKQTIEYSSNRTSTWESPKLVIFIIILYFSNYDRDFK